MASEPAQQAQSKTAQTAHESFSPLSCFTRNRGACAGGQGRRRPLPMVARSPTTGPKLAAAAAELPLSPSFLPLSLFHYPRHGTVPVARPATTAGWTSTGRTPRAGGGHWRPPRPGETASTPLGLNQRGSQPAPAQEKGLWPSRPSLPPPVPHRTPPPVPVGPPAKAWARRGDGHAARPEPRLALAGHAAGPEPRSAREDAMASSPGSLSLTVPSLCLSHPLAWAGAYQE